LNQLQLLLRPHWIDGESWAGFLLRLADANEFAGIWPLGHLLGVRPLRLLVEQPRAVLDALGYNGADAPKAHYPALRATRSPMGHAGPRPRLGLRGRGLESAFCPYCLAEDKVPHLRALWERPLEIGCRRHGTTLLRRCTDCGCTVRADRATLLECPCGARFAEQQAALLDRSWEDVPPVFSLTRGPALSETFQPTSFEEMVAASVVERLALYERQQESASRKKRASAKPSPADVLSAVPWFQDWPHAFKFRYREALQRGRTIGEERCTSYIQAKTLFAPLFPKIQRAVAHVTRINRVGPNTIKSYGAADYLSSAEQSAVGAIKLLGISRTQVMWLFQTGALPGAKRLTKEALAIPTETVLDIMAQFSEMEDWDTAAKRRGFSPQAMKQLLRLGLLPAVSLGDYGASKLAPAVWDEFADFLLLQATPLPKNATQTVKLQGVIFKSNFPVPDPDRTARLLSAIAQGTLQLYASRRTPKRLDELRVSMAELKRIVPRNT
jgi:hypothetical protein